MPNYMSSGKALPANPSLEDHINKAIAIVVPYVKTIC